MAVNLGDVTFGVHANTSPLGRAQTPLHSFGGAAQNTAGRVDRFNVAMRNMASATTFAVGPLSGVGARITALGAIAGRTELALAGTIAGITAAGVAAVRLSRSANQAGRDLERIQRRLTILDGSSYAAAQSFEELGSLADRTGTDFVVLADSFNRFQAAAAGTTLEGEGMRQVFEDVTYAASQFQLEAVQVEGVLRALEQMMSKGTVQAEELRGQVGDRLPGAFQIAARAMGVTTSELNDMLKAGEVLAEDFLPRFGEEIRRTYGAEGVGRIENYQATVGRLGNSWREFAAAVNETFGITRVFVGTMQSLTNAFSSLSDNLDVVVGAFGALAGVLATLAIPVVVRGFIALNTAVKSVAASMAVLQVQASLVGAVIMAHPLRAFIAIAGRASIALGAAAAGFYAFRSATHNQRQELENLTASVSDYIKAHRQISEAERARFELTKTREEYLKSVRGGPTGAPDVMRTAGLRSEIASTIAEIQAQYDKAIAARDELLEGARSPGGALRLELGGEAQARELEALEAQITTFMGQLERLRELQKEQADAARERGQEEVDAMSAAVKAAEQSISRVGQETEALDIGIGAVKALQAEFDNTDAVDKFREKLVKVEGETERVDFLTRQYAEGLRLLQVAQRDVAIGEFGDRMERLNQEIEALGEGGTEAAEKLRRSFEIDDVVEATRQELISMQVPIDRAGRMAESLRATLEELDVAREAAEEAERLADNLEEAHAWAQALGGLDMSSGINGATAAAVQLTSQLGIAYDLALQIAQERQRATQAPAQRSGITGAFSDRFGSTGDPSMGSANVAFSNLTNNRRNFGRAPVGSRFEYDKKKGGGGGGGSDDPFDLFEQSRQQIEQLKQNITLLGETEAAAAGLRAKWALLNRAKEEGINLDAQVNGSSMTVRQEIERQAAQIETLTAAYERAREHANFYKQAQDDLKEGILDVITEGEKLTDVLGNLAKALARAYFEAALFNSGPFAQQGNNQGLLGGILGNLLGAVMPAAPLTAGTVMPSTGGQVMGLGGLVPKLAGGTDFHPGGWALLGEEGPEFAHLPRGTQVYPNGEGPEMGGFNFNYSPNIDARGADEAAIRRLEESQARMAREIPKVVMKTLRDGQNHGQTRKVLRGIG